MKHGREGFAWSVGGPEASAEQTSVWVNLAWRISEFSWVDIHSRERSKGLANVNSQSFL